MHKSITTIWMFVRCHAHDRLNWCLVSLSLSLYIYIYGAFTAGLRACFLSDLVVGAGALIIDVALHSAIEHRDRSLLIIDSSSTMQHRQWRLHAVFNERRAGDVPHNISPQFKPEVSVWNCNELLDMAYPTSIKVNQSVNPLVARRAVCTNRWIFHCFL